MLCLQEIVLEAFKEFKANHLNTDNNMLRFPGYKQYTWWVHGYLGSGNKRLSPPMLRDKFPSENKIYMFLLWKEIKICRLQSVQPKTPLYL